MRNAVPRDADPRITSDSTAHLRLIEPSPMAVALPNLLNSTCSYFTPAKLEAFVAVAEEGGFSAAARRLCVSQPALSQTINAIERRLGVELFMRRTTGVEQTEAGQALLGEARAILSRYDQLLPAMARYKGESGGVIRLGIPHELASEVLCGLSRFAACYPETRVQPRHLPMPGQLVALRSGQLDVSFMVQLPSGRDLDNMLVAREDMGVLFSDTLALRLAGADGVRLDALAGLDWVAFPRSTSPSWYDELAAILRTHGIDVGAADRGDQFPIPSVALTALSSGSAFALAPRPRTDPVPNAIVWRPLTNAPLVRSTWAVWPASSRRRDVARLVGAFAPT